MTQLRILHLASGDLWAGAEAQLYYLVRSLAERPEVAVSVVLLNEGELSHRLRLAKIEVQVIDEAQFGALSLLQQLGKLIRRIRPHLIHTHRTKENALGALSSLSFAGMYSLRTVHGSLENPGGAATLRRRVALMLDRVLIARLQRCAVAVSQPLAEELRLQLPIKSVYVIRNGIDVSDVLMHAAAPYVFEPTHALAVCFIGRLVPVKRIDVFLQAAALIARKHPGKYRFYIVGDGPLRASLERSAQTLALNEHCTFLGFQRNCIPLLRTMRALVLTSDHEGTPMVALEALVLGVPLVAHAVGGLIELVQSPSQGQLVRSQDPQQVAAAIMAVAATGSDPLRPRESLLPAEYTIQRCAEEHVRLYLALASRRIERVH